MLSLRAVNGTVSTGARFVVAPFDGRTELAWVYPEGSTPPTVSLISIVAGLAPDQPTRLWLRTSFQVRLDDSREHLAVVRSVFALVIDQGSKRPAVRVEYDRDQGNEPDDATPARHRRSAAHVQIHGSSEELAYVQGLKRRRRQRRLGSSDPTRRGVATGITRTMRHPRTIVARHGTTEDTILMIFSSFAAYCV